MKTTILFLCFFVSCLICNAGKTPPAAVGKAFAEKFQHVEKVKWSVENANEWEAEFVMNGKETSASFDLTGKWLETEIGMNKADLPQEVRASLDKQFPGAKIIECVKLESPDFKGYEMDLKHGSQSLEVKASPEGKLTVKNETVKK
jgi:predicted oxidoreductase